MLKKLPALFAGLLVALTAFAVGESELRNGHPDTYTVKRGDTLWDISARFLKNPGFGRKSGRPIRRSRTRT